MIVVKVELHSAITGTVKEIGRAYIANDGTGTAKRGNYFAKVARKQPSGKWPNWFSAMGKFVRKGEVKDYPRQSYNVWRLVIRSLLACFPEEQNGISDTGSSSGRNKQTAAV